jgi:spermidine synthase
MNEKPSSRRFLPLILLLFFGSGCAALVYEVVWFQMLQMVVGSTAVSLAVVLATYMGGMCIGSLLLPRRISPRRHPLRVYALIELGIGLIALLVLLAMPLVDKIYAAIGGPGFLGIVFRGVICAVCLLPPTILMGGTLPAVSRWVESTPSGVSWLGFLYSGNTVGAVAGCATAGFYLLRVYDVTTATFVAAAVNGFIALVAFLLSTRAAHDPTALESTSGVLSAQPPPGTFSIQITIALSGLTALAAEVIWTRLLSLMLGGTVYTFSIILAVFLLGLGLGSAYGSTLGRRVRSPRIALGYAQFLIALGVAWTAFMIAKSLPYWPISGGLAKSAWVLFQVDMVRCLWAVLPPAFFWGASFPLALAAAASRGQDPGRLVGRIYAANTIGSIIGSIGFSVFLVPLLGTQNSNRLLIILAAASGLIALGPLLKPSAKSARNGAAGFEGAAAPGPTVKPFAFGGLIAGALILALTVPNIPWQLVAWGRNILPKAGYGSALYVGEGMNSSVAVVELADGTRNFHVSGKVEASSDPTDLRLERMLGHIPALVHPNPRSVLIVGCGAGITAGTFVLYPGIERIVICEIEPLIPKVVARYFGPQNYNVLEDPRVQVVYDDARHFVLTTKEKFDIITSDPIHPWVKGSATLYSREYFELVKSHLNPGGVITQWVPLYESTTEVVKSEFATFFKVFPGGTMWGNDNAGLGYDVVMLAQDGPTRIDVDALENRLVREDHRDVLQSINEIGFRSAVSLLSTFGGLSTDLEPWYKDGEINLDRNLRLQYLAGFGLNLYRSPDIYEDILRYRKYPEAVFEISPERKEALLKMMGIQK